MQPTKGAMQPPTKLVEVHCEMRKPFADAYVMEKNPVKKELFCMTNPDKMASCEYLCLSHLKVHDKVVVLCDSVAALKLYGKSLDLGGGVGFLPDRQRMCIVDDETPEEDRATLYKRFTGSDYMGREQIYILGIAYGGEVATIEIPPITSVVIQISSRMGGAGDVDVRSRLEVTSYLHTFYKSDTYFYTLVSLGTEDVLYSEKRQQDLVERGHTVHVTKNLLSEMNRTADMRHVCSQDPCPEGALPDEGGYLGHISVAFQEAAVEKIEESDGVIDYTRARKKKREGEKEDTSSV